MLFAWVKIVKKFFNAIGLGALFKPLFLTFCDILKLLGMKFDINIKMPDIEGVIESTKKDVKTVQGLLSKESFKNDTSGLIVGSGGSMTITSLGGIGGSFFTPIINFPEVAILGIGKSQKKQIYINGKFETRIMLPISLSYDHRIIDGAEAARFNNDLKENLGKNFAYKLAV